MKNILKKTAVFLIGLFIIVLILEVILRLVGFIGQGEADTDISNADMQSNYTILCAGDSFTRGIGAPSGNDYPSFLQDLFNRKKDTIVRIVNTSVAGKNSAQIMNTLRDEILQVKPDMLILLMGGANHWNFWGYKSSLDLPGSAFSGTSFFENFRVYKLIRLLTRNVEDKIESEKQQSARSHLEEENYKKAIDKFNIAIAKNPKDGRAFYDMGAFYMYERNTGKAAEWFGKGIEANPDFPDNYLGMGAVYRELGQDGKRSEWYMKGIYDSKGKGKEVIYALTLLDMLQLSKFDMAMPLLEKAIGEFPNCSDFYRMLRNMKESYPDGSDKIEALLANEPPAEKQHIIKLGDVNFNDVPSDNPALESDKALIMKWVRSDYIKAIELCREMGVELLILNYPLRGRDWNTFSMAYKKANEVIFRITQEYSLPLVNNKVLFDRAPGGIDLYLEPTGSAEHCNETGYRFMAENIYSLLERMDLKYRDFDKEKKPSSTGESIVNENSDYEKAGDELLNNNQYGVALEKFTLAIKEKPSSMLYLKSGDIKALLGRDDEAMADFEKAVELDPENALAYNSRGRLNFDKGEFESALKDYDKAIKINPGMIDAYNNRGYLKSAMEDYKGAVKDYDILLRYAPNHALALNNRGYARYMMKDYNGAINDIGNSLSTMPGNSYAYRNRALVYIALKRYKDALADLNKARELGFARDYGGEVDKLIEEVKSKH